MDIFVLFRFSKKTGKIDTTMTGMGCATMKMWALQNTTKTKVCIIMNRTTGEVVFLAQGSESGFPKIKKTDLGSCEDFGISLEMLHSITDDRFDKEA